MSQAAPLLWSKSRTKGDISMASHSRLPVNSRLASGSLWRLPKPRTDKAGCQRSCPGSLERRIKEDLRPPVQTGLWGEGCTEPQSGAERKGIRKEGPQEDPAAQQNGKPGPGC